MLEFKAEFDKEDWSMRTSTAAPTYNVVAKTVHWLSALLIIGMLFLGWSMTYVMKDPERFNYFQLHKSFGIVILFLSLFRLYWRLTHQPPELPLAMATWERVLAKTTHIIFYVLIIGIPLSGWALVSSAPRNIPTMIFGFIPWPHLPYLPTLHNKRVVGHIFSDIHAVLAYSLASLLVLHVAAALKHHFINHDDVLMRMLPKFMRLFRIG